MMVFGLEMKRGMKALLIWSAVIGGMIFLCLLLFPELKKEVGDMMESLGAAGGFTAAFGMDQLNYGEISGFYGIYGGSMLGIGGIFYAAILGTGMLAKEEKEHTAEFLLTHPVSRSSVYVQKLLAMLVQIALVNVLVIVCSLIGFQVIGETPEWKGFWLFHAAQILMQVEILCICYGISAFLRRGGISIGIGVAAVFYFLGLFRNITEQAEAAKYITPYAYADAAEIIPSLSLDGTLILLGMCYAAVGLIAGFVKYVKKDIHP